MIDFGALAARLLQQSRSLLPAWLPGGKFSGKEFVVGNLSGEKGTSLSINCKTGAWKDFATGDAGGDLISLYAAIHGMSQADAARQLDDGTIASRTPPSSPVRAERQRRNVVMPVPDGVRPCPCKHYKYGLPVAVWDYLDADGRLLGYVARYEPAGERKQIVPWTYADDKWGMGQFPSPRPLYGLRELAERPTAPVIVVEGEKAADACRKLAPQYVTVTWPGGAQAWRKAGFDALKGRASVLLWPDADDPGITCMWEIGHALLKLCPTVKIIIPDGVSDGFDAADALAEGWTWQSLKDWALPRVKLISEGGDYGKSGSTQPGSTQSRSQQTDRSELPAQASGAVGMAAGGLEQDGRPAQDQDREAAAGDAALARDRGAAKRMDETDHRAETDDKRSMPGPRRAHDGTVEAQSGNHSARRNDGRSAPADFAAGTQTPVIEGPQSQVARWIEWRLDRNGHGNPLSNLNNAVSIIENDPALRGIVWYDEFLQRLMTGDPAREWTEADDINLALYMQRTLGLTKMSKDLASQAVVATAFSHPRNCVKEWLESLPAWDGIERCNAFFVDVFGAEESAYSTAVGGNFWKSLVARATQPGCKVDNMVVLEGPQGLRKSTALALIVGERWFAEAREEITQKDFYVSLQGKLLVEIAELDAFSRADVTKIKQVVTCRVDRFRPPYGRTAIDHARQGVFVATTNKTDWNRDDTGARRFWPIRCNGDVRLDLVAENRVQYYAEALARLKAGETWWEMPQAETKREQDARYDADPWLDRIRNIVMGESSVTTMQIMDKLGLDVSKQDRGTQMRVGSCMRILGWERKQARDGLKRAYLYMKGDDGDDGGDKKLF